MKVYILTTTLLLAGCISVFPDAGEPAKKVSLSLCSVKSHRHAIKPNVLIIERPQAPSDIATKNLRIVHSGNCIPIIDHIADYEWEEKIPDLLESAILTGIEQSHIFKGVAKSSQYVKGDLILMTEIRRFEVVALCNPHVEVELSFTIVTQGEHKIIAQRVLKYQEPIECVTLPEILGAYSCVVDYLLIDLTTWLTKVKIPRELRKKADGNLEKKI